jgi:hypothetical protein
MIRGKHRRMAQRKHVLQHRFVRTGRTRTLAAGLQAPAQRLALTFGALEPVAQDVALTAALLELGVQAAAAGQPGGEITNDACETTHLGDNSLAMSIARGTRVATLWNLMLDKNRIRCAVYQGAHGMELRLESGRGGVIFSEPFDMQPRLLARTRALRESLKRRGWRDG